MLLLRSCCSGFGELLLLWLNLLLPLLLLLSLLLLLLLPLLLRRLLLLQGHAVPLRQLHSLLDLPGLLQGEHPTAEQGIRHHGQPSTICPRTDAPCKCQHSSLTRASDSG